MSKFRLIDISHLRNCLFVFFCLFTTIIISQDFTYTLDEYGFDDGLAYKQINTVFEDRDGLIWLGTSKGLLRYDGEEFKIWNSEDETGLIYSIRLISQDDEGILWLWNSESHQFVFLNPYTGEIQSTKAKFGDKFPNRLDANTSTPGFALPSKELTRSSKGHLYLTTSLLDHFYSYHSSTGFKKISVPNKVVNIYACIEDTLFVGTGESVVSKYSIEGELYGEKEFSEQEKLLLKTQEKDPNKKHTNITSIINRNYKNPAFYNAINSLNTVKNDSINNCFYLFTRYNWLAINYKNDTIINLNADDFKNPDLFRHENLIVDSRNNVWVFGHFGLVRLKIEENRFRKILSKSEGGNIACRGISSDKHHIYVNGENLHTTYKVSKSDNTVEQIEYDEFPRAILKLQNDELLVGCAEVYKSKGNLESFSKIDFYPKEDYWWGNNYGIWSLFQDSYGTIWAGKGNYLAVKRHGDKLFRSHRPSEKELRKSSKKQSILSIIPEGKDSLWLCSEGGLFLFDIAKDEIVSHYHEHESNYLPASKFYHLHKDKTGKYWLGTNKGLIEWDGPNNSDQFNLYTIKDNLSNDVIYSVYEDEQNRLWMSSDYGIMSFEKKEKTVHAYLEKNGISHYEFNRTSHYQEPNGVIYFGGLNGVTYFDPQDFEHNPLGDMELIVSELNIFDGESEQLLDKTSELLESNTITFNPSDKYFKLKFSLPTFDGKNNKMYAWKIEGIHTEWNYQQANSIELGMVPYGNYKLIIKGRTKESSWSQNPLEIDLEIKKPFYLTLWFLVVSLLFICSVVVMFFKLRTRLLKKKIEEATIQIMSDKRIIEQQSVDLKKLDKLKTQFFTNVSHELRTPLTLMMGPIKRLMTTSPENVADNSIMLGMLHRNTVQLRNLVDEILDLSKLENNKMALEETAVILNSHINNHLKQYYSFCSNEEIIFIANINIDKDLTLLVDLKKFDKVLNNFLVNAIKFTSENGYVIIDVIEKEDNILVSVKDTGRGIHPDDMLNIFDRFYQSKYKDYGSEGGTGIGLSLCKELAELMEGKVWAESEVEKGSIFYFSFPIKKAIVAHVIDPLDISSSTTPKQIEVFDENTLIGELKERTILVVEDNKDLREYQRIILGDYNIVLSENGKEALDYLNNNDAPDIILSDLMMPVMDGMELIEKVKSIDKLRHIPFIMLTAKTNQQVKIRALRYGIDDYLTKPFDEEELKVRVANLLLFQKNRLASIEIEANNDNDTKKELRHLLSQSEMEWLESLELMIIDNLKNEYLNVTMLSKEMAMSESTLLRQLKKLTGMTPGKYIQELRLNQAKEYLLNKSFKTISLVSYNVGFKDSNSFSRTFKKRFGKKPSEIG